MSDFKNTLKESIEKMVPLDHDDYDEIKWSDDFYLHVWSMDKGEGYIEFEAIVPHSSGAPKDETFLSAIPGADQFTDAIESVLEDMYSETRFSHVEFHLQDVVGSKIADEPHSVYYSQQFHVDGDTVRQD